MHEDWADILGLTLKETSRAVRKSMDSLSFHRAMLRDEGHQVITKLVKENRLEL